MAKKSVQDNTNLFTKTVKTLDDYKEEYKNNPQILRNIERVKAQKAKEAAYFKMPQNKPSISFDDLDDGKPLTSKQRNKLLITCIGKIIECIAETL